jgi:hypothetical protein
MLVPAFLGMCVNISLCLWLTIMCVFKQQIMIRRGKLL